MSRIRKIVAVSAAVLCLSFAAGCSNEPGFMGNTGEVSLEEGDVFAVISIMNYGDITVKLFPQAAPNAVKQFINSVNDKYYDGRTIHRVVKDQLIQGGSLTGTGFDGDIAPQEYFATETSKYMCHYYGALCMAKNANGNYRQFYIVSNNEPVNVDEIAEKITKDLDNAEIADKMLEDDKKFYREYCNKLKNLPAEVKERYARVGGIYDYDGEDTVFGQVVDGEDVLKAINGIETIFGNNSDDKSEIASKPIDEIVIEKIEVIRIAPSETVSEEKTRATRAPSPSVTTEQIIVNDGNGEISDQSSDVPETVAPDSSSGESETVPQTDAEPAVTATGAEQTPQSSPEAE